MSRTEDNIKRVEAGVRSTSGGSSLLSILRFDDAAGGTNHVVTLGAPRHAMRAPAEGFDADWEDKLRRLEVPKHRE